MIQRKQSVYLLLVFIVVIIMQLPNIWAVKGELNSDKGQKYQYSLSFTGLTISSNEISTVPRGNIRYAFIICGIIALVSIFLYRKLPTQMRLVAFNFIFIILAIFYFSYDLYKLKTIEHIVSVHISWQWAIILPLAMLVLNYLALRGIRKDIQLLASADRLR